MPWEACVALGNETGKDLYINIPSNASRDYINKLADLFAYGSDGVNPYTSPQSNPVWAPLELQPQGLHRVLQRDLELGLQPSRHGRQRLVQPTVAAGGLRLPGEHYENDPLYPGGGANAYNDGAIVAPQYITARQPRPP